MIRKSLLLAFISLFPLVHLAHATFNSGSTGADGPFNPSANIEVVLPPNGVLNYTTINIPAGVTVTFRKNAANTPVYMLATSDVTIAGIINIAGGNATATVAGPGGPGGFAGGYGGAPAGKGLGPGGGNFGSSGGAGGGFGTSGISWGGATGGGTYGNQVLSPLIGGSGGGAGGSYQRNGGGGGGAITIASSTTIFVSGSIKANGGSSYYDGWNGGGGGSGGAIKLIANIISGNGSITATGGYASTAGFGGSGRIRLEADTNNRTAGTDPPYTLGVPSSVFPPSIPTLNITSIAGVTVPSSPTGAYNQPDISLPSNTVNPIAVNISSSNIPVGTTVKVWVIPQYGSATSVDTILSGTDQSSTASANVNLSTNYSNIVTAEATFTILQAMYWQGEEIEKVRVATRMGSGNKTVYITKSGKEISGDLLAGVYR